MGVDVSSVCVEAIGTGQAAAIYPVTPTNSRPTEAPRTLIAKLPSQGEGVREQVASGYRAEYAFYTRVADTVDMPRPQVYHYENSRDGTEFVLLLSDPAPAVQGDRIRVCTDTEASLTARGVRRHSQTTMVRSRVAVA
jgi:hypothetical protein